MNYKSSADQAPVIIFGASGYLGSRLYQHFTDKGSKVLGTCRANQRNGLLHFDLASSSLDQLGVPLTGFTHAILCAGPMPMDFSKTHSAEAHEINKGIKRLAQDLLNRNITPLFLSTDYVFDGSKGDYKEDDEAIPILEYGKRKMEIEAFLTGQGQPAAIARLSHICGSGLEDDTLLNQITTQLLNAETIRCAKDQVFSPTYIDDSVRAIDQMIQMGLVGCYHVAPPEKFNRFEIATLIKESLEIKTGQVEPCSLHDLDFPDNRPLNTSLNVDKFLQDTGFEFTPLRDSITRLRSLVALRTNGGSESMDFPS